MDLKLLKSCCVLTDKPTMTQFVWLNVANRKNQNFLEMIYDFGVEKRGRQGMFVFSNSVAPTPYGKNLMILCDFV